MDVVVTVPKGEWANWLSEGDLAGEEWSGREYGFYVVRHPLQVTLGDRIYVVAGGKLRGYSPLVRLDLADRFGGSPGSFALVRRGDAVAVTIPLGVRGFQGYRYRWWRREVEVPFPEWEQL
jgi:hypothetical protein